MLKLTQELRPRIPVLFLDTGYHFAETYTYRDRMAAAWNLNLINLEPANTVAQQEAEHGMLHQHAPDRCCALRKVEPLFAAVAGYKVWLTGLRREQARSRTALDEVANFTLPGGVTVRKLSPFADWTTRDVWQLCEHFGISLLPLYGQGYTSSDANPAPRFPPIRTIHVPAGGRDARSSAASTFRLRQKELRTPNTHSARMSLRASLHVFHTIAQI